MENTVYAGGYTTPKPWMVYIGGFGAYYDANFHYGGNYSSNIFGGSNQVFENDVFQQGISTGAQIGFQYHLHTPYFLGLNFSAAINANKARLTNFAYVAPGPAPVFVGGGDIHHEFRINANWDIAALVGADITAQTQLYAKFGLAGARCAHELFTTRVTSFPFPIPVFSQLERKNLLGWIVGLGLSHDLNRWASVFAEYDRYAYGHYELNNLDFILIPSNANTDHLTQHVKINAAVFRLGLNLKLMDAFTPQRYAMITNPWMFYMGGFVGYYTANFRYGGNYFSNTFTSSNQAFNDDVLQQGVSGGAQIGLHYHLHSAYFLGLNILTAIHANKARLANFIYITPGLFAGNINNQLRINTNWDVAAVVGADITSQTHVYAKLGISYVRLANTLFTTQVSNVANPIPLFYANEHRHLVGWVAGIGLTHDLNKWLSAFAEYDRYVYGNYGLNSADSIFSTAAIDIDHLTRQVRISPSTVRLGLNLKFIGAFTPAQFASVTDHWIAYLGGFMGYTVVNFQYGATYFSSVFTPVNQVFNNNSFQQGVSGGGQIGLHYHWRCPYFVGLNVSAASNAHKARLVNFVFVGAGGTGNIHNQFDIQSNWDIAAVIGADVTSQTHVYAKFGFARARLMHKLFLTQVLFSSFAIPVFSQNQRIYLLGWMVGVGLTHDINKRLNVFAEYDRNDYGANGGNKLKTAVIQVGSPTTFDSLLQHVRIASYAVRLGLNVKFKV